VYDSHHSAGHHRHRIACNAEWTPRKPQYGRLHHHIVIVRSLIEFGQIIGRVVLFSTIFIRRKQLFLQLRPHIIVRPCFLESEQPSQCIEQTGISILFLKQAKLHQ
jgi:hypothetical protein